jgi:hypothetical protein
VPPPASGGLPGSLPIPDGPPTSSLAVSSLTVRLFLRAGQAQYQYEPGPLVITETSGRSAATVQAIEVYTPNGISEHDCPGIGGAVRIGPGQTLDLAKPLSYCMPYGLSYALASTVTVRVTFVDDEGRPGQIQQSKDVSACTLNGKPGLVLCD